MFKTIYGKRQRGEPAPAGDKIVPIYEQVISEETGEPILVQVGEHNLHEYIQSHADSCDVYKMIERFNAGDTWALYSSYYDNYGDATELPKTLREVQDAILLQTQIYDSLPEDIRKSYTKAEFFALSEDELTALFAKEDVVDEQEHANPIQSNPAGENSSVNI